MPILHFYDGTRPLFRHRLRPGRTSIGRADSCDVVLPGEGLSRTHCFIDGRDGEWVLVDRSRHGLELDGAPAKRAVLSEGSRIGLGQYAAVLHLMDAETEPTASHGHSSQGEQVVGTDEASLLVERVSMVVSAGPEAGQRKAIKRNRVSVGGPGSDIVLRDPSLLAEHCRLRIARSRVMVEPAKGAVMLHGERLRDLTPLLPGEELHLGQTVIHFEVGVVQDVPFLSRFGEMVGESKPMKQSFGILQRVADHDFPVLVLGESGTGKELAARGIHDYSSRATKPFIAVNCGAIGAELFESELFGHEKGAFTGAERKKDGAFQAADGGTLFLDEVGELPEAAQVKLLRSLESGEVRRVGATAPEFPDVRVLAATNRDLGEEVRDGRFRGDLFFRLAVLSVTLPPLRDRLGDLELLCQTLCRNLHPDASVRPDALEVLRRHEWPGNVRELRNVLTRAYVLGGPKIGVDFLSFHDLGARRKPAAPAPSTNTLDDAERGYIVDVMQRHGDNRSTAARELGIARSTLQYKLKKYGMM